MVSPEPEEAISLLLEELAARAGVYPGGRGREEVATARQAGIEIALELIELVESGER